MRVVSGWLHVTVSVWCNSQSKEIDFPSSQSLLEAALLSLAIRDSATR